MMKRIALTTLGCKANWADTEAVAQALAGAGLAIVPFDEEAEAYVVNTCTVTSIAGAQSRQMLRRARRNNPRAIIVAAGCLGEVDTAHASVPGVDAVFGARDRAALIAYLCERLCAAVPATIPESAVGPLPTAPQSRSRAFLKIQDGCNRRCAYCIIPRARGRSRSLPVTEVAVACAALSIHHREILLAGIDLGQYGRDLPGRPTLSGLLEQISATPGMARLHVSSLDPLQVDDRLLELLAQRRGICRHVHLSIQSGSDAVLARMARGYRGRDIERTVCGLARRVPGIAVTGDIIAGFPGETEAQHRETVALLESLPIAGLHVFPFSPREGTAAAAMPRQVAPAVRKRRAAELRALARCQRLRALKELIGVTLEVICTSREPEEDGLVIGVADNGVSLRLPPGTIRYGGLGHAMVTQVNGLSVKGHWA